MSASTDPNAKKEVTIRFDMTNFQITTQIPSDMSVDELQTALDSDDARIEMEQGELVLHPPNDGESISLGLISAFDTTASEFQNIEVEEAAEAAAT